MTGITGRESYFGYRRRIGDRSCCKQRHSMSGSKLRLESDLGWRDSGAGVRRVYRIWTVLECTARFDSMSAEQSLHLHRPGYQCDHYRSPHTWFQQVQLYTPAQYYAIGIASPNYVPIDSYDSGNWGNRIYHMIPLFGAYGVSPSLLHSVCNWAATIWPEGNWSSLPQCGR
jgi:hypothetical protein